VVGEQGDGDEGDDEREGLTGRRRTRGERRPLLSSRRPSGSSGNLAQVLEAAASEDERLSPRAAQLGDGLPNGDAASYAGEAKEPSGNSHVAPASDAQPAALSKDAQGSGQDQEQSGPAKDHTQAGGEPEVESKGEEKAEEPLQSMVRVVQARG
jgi:hypothetical protein